MRAAGYYPSDADIQGVQAHVKFLADMTPEDDADLFGGGGDSASSGCHASAKSGSVDLNTFLQLFLSHRPVVELGQQQIQAAFATLAPSTGGVRVCVSGTCSLGRRCGT